MELSQINNIKNTSKNHNDVTNNELPQFPLFPVSKGFCKCLQRNVDEFHKALVEESITTDVE